MKSALPIALLLPCATFPYTVACAAAGRGREAATAYLELLSCELLRLFFDVDVETASSLRTQTYFKTRQEAMQKAHELLGDATELWQQLDAFIESTKAEAAISEYAGQLTQLVQSLPLEERLGCAAACA